MTDDYVFNVREKQTMIGQACNLAAAHLREIYKDPITPEGKANKEFVEAFKRLTQTYYISLYKIQRRLMKAQIKDEEGGQDND